MGAGAKPTADDLILRIYDTTVDTSLWPELLQDIAEFCNARGAFIFEIEGDGAERRLNAARYSAIFDPDIVRGYIQLHHDAEMGDQEYFASRSQMSDAIELVPDTEIGTLLDDGESGVHTFDRPHMQMQIQFGFKHRAGALLNKDDLFRDRFALQFSVEHGVANPEDCARAAQIMPHLAKAISLARPSNQLQRRFQSVAQAMDNLKTGVCVLDHDHRVVFHNNEFSRQMDAYRAFRIAPDGKLAFSQDKFDRSLIELFDSPHAHGRFGARPRKEAVASEIGGDNDFALCVEIAPLASAEGFGETTLDGFIVYSPVSYTHLTLPTKA